MNDNKEAENIKELGKNEVVNSEKRIQILPIIGEIEGHKAEDAQVKTTKYEHLIPQLFAMEQNKEVEGILMVLNTVGGDVEAGLAIAEMINTLSKPTVSIVIGGGHSIGVPLATAADYSFITSSATMIIHPIRMNGFIIGIPQTFNYFEKMQERINKFIVKTSNITEEDLSKYMSNTGNLLNDVGTMLVGEEAVKCGLIDEVGGVYEALNKLETLIVERKKE